MPDCEIAALSPDELAWNAQVDCMEQLIHRLRVALGRLLMPATKLSRHFIKLHDLIFSDARHQRKSLSRHTACVSKMRETVLKAAVLNVGVAFVRCDPSLCLRVNCLRLLYRRSLWVLLGQASL
jgi:hypothetical protein